MGKKENRKRQMKVNVTVLALALLAAVAVAAAIAAFCLGYTKRGGTETDSIRGGMVVDARVTGEESGQPAENPLAGRSVYFSGIEDTVIGRETVVRLDNKSEAKRS